MTSGHASRLRPVSIGIPPWSAWRTEPPILHRTAIMPSSIVHHLQVLASSYPSTAVVLRDLPAEERCHSRRLRALLLDRLDELGEEADLAGFPPAVEAAIENQLRTPSATPASW